jgi:hypothetical protein
MQASVKNSSDDALISSERILTRLLEQIWQVLLVVLTLAGASSVLRAPETGWLGIYSLHLTLQIFFSACYLLRNRLSFDVRIGIVMIIFYIVGSSGLFLFGMVAAGAWWLILCALIGKMFYPLRLGILHALACLLLILAAAACYMSGLLTLPFDAAVYIRSPATWGGLIIGCALMSLFIFAAVSAYQRAALGLLREVADHKQQLLQRMHEIQTLRSFIPICAQCKQVRDDKGYWASVEDYLQKNSDISFSHCMCPDCGRKLYGEDWDQAMQETPDGPGPRAAAVLKPRAE